MILAGDVGGTKTLLGLFKQSRGSLVRVREESFPSQRKPSLEAIVRTFLDKGEEKVHRCAVGVAGPVVAGRSHVVNLRWPVDERRLRRVLGIRHVKVLNDLEATAWGLGEVKPSRFRNLTPGLRPRPGNAVLIAAGTGLGTTILFWDGERHHPSAGEGGHQDFAPRDDDEIELMRFLSQKLGRVSVERVVAGPGMSAIFRFLVETGRGRETPEMSRRMAGGDPNQVISEAGVRGEDPTAARSVEMFVSLYGAAAGNLALVARAVGGVFVGGGIAPKILPKLESGEFLSSFRAKGRLTPLLEKIPVKVILEPRTALLGAAAAAASFHVPSSRGRA